jgi:hypothetical protein
MSICISLQHITLIFLILANIVFMPCEETDGVSVTDEYPLHAVAKLLGIEDEVELTEALISNVNFIKGMSCHRRIVNVLIVLSLRTSLV